MLLKQPLLAIGVLLSATTFNAQASLTSYTGTDGAGLVYSSVSDVTWTQDANLFKTLYLSNANLVSQIAAVTPTYNDPNYGLQTIDAADFNTGNGRMSWWGAKAFVNYLNNINYGGSNQWRLPTVGSNLEPGYELTNNELSQLFYSELGGSATNIIPDSTTFSNEEAFFYWLDTENALYASDAWSFDTFDGGYLGAGSKTNHFYAWAVSPGQVPAVPVPSAVWLMGSGLLGLLRLKRRGHAG